MSLQLHFHFRRISRTRRLPVSRTIRPRQLRCQRLHLPEDYRFPTRHPLSRDIPGRAPRWVWAKQRRLCPPMEETPPCRMGPTRTRLCRFRRSDTVLRTLSIKVETDLEPDSPARLLHVHMTMPPLNPTSVHDTHSLQLSPPISILHECISLSECFSYQPTRVLLSCLHQLHNPNFTG